MSFFWWEEVDSCKSESERACTYSEASSSEIGGSESTHAEEVDSFNSGTGKFTCISGASAPKRWFRRNAPRGENRAEYTLPSIKKRHRIAMSFFLVGRGGFEPPKAVPTDLQSAPFGHSGIFPRLELVVGVEPTTC